MATLKITFGTAKNDITSAWESPLRASDRITREWIYGVDPETMEFVKAIFEVMPGDYSLYRTFVRVMKVNSFEELLNVA